MQRRPSSVFRPGCSFIVILGDHFQRCCSSLSRSINQSLPSLHRSSAAAHAFAARVHPPTPLSFTLRDESASVPALLESRRPEMFHRGRWCKGGFCWWTGGNARRAAPSPPAWNVCPRLAAKYRRNFIKVHPLVLR